MIAADWTSFPAGDALIAPARGDQRAAGSAGTPFFFDGPAGKLFGMYFQCAGHKSAETAVLVCPPVGHEYVRSYHAIRRLCTRLARHGIPALKFDYRGLGDSAGDGDVGHADEWRDDIRAASAEIAKRSGVEDVTILGLRMGASLAAGLQSDACSFRDLVLWDPVVDGNAYLDELQRMHRSCVADLRRFRSPDEGRATPGELLGFPCSGALQDSLRLIRLIDRPYPYDNCFLITSQERAEYEALWASLRRNVRGRVTQDMIAEPADWANHGKVESALIANRIPSAIFAKIANGFV